MHSFSPSFSPSTAGSCQSNGANHAGQARARPMSLHRTRGKGQYSSGNSQYSDVPWFSPDDCTAVTGGLKTITRPGQSQPSQRQAGPNTAAAFPSASSQEALLHQTSRRHGRQWVRCNPIRRRAAAPTSHTVSGGQISEGRSTPAQGGSSAQPRRRGRALRARPPAKNTGHAPSGQSAPGCPHTGHSAGAGGPGATRPTVADASRRKGVQPGAHSLVPTIGAFRGG